MKIKLSIILVLFWMTASAKQQTEFPIKVLKVGDTLSVNMELGKMINGSQTSMKISDSKADLIILDFWATWCAPCVAFFNTTESLAKEFKGRVQIIPITSEEENTVLPFLKKMQQVKGIFPSSIVSDTKLTVMFPHTYIPHEVWIDKQGVVKAITGNNEVNSANITTFLNTGNIVLSTKVDQVMKEYSMNVPIYMGNQPAFKPEEGLSYYAVFKKYDSGLMGMYNLMNEKFITCTNSSILGMCQVFFGDLRAEFQSSKRTILEIKDTSAVTYIEGKNKEPFQQWAEKNAYNFELAIGDTSLIKEKYNIMKQELSNYVRFKLGMDIRMEKRKTLCWELVRTSKTDKLRSKGGSPVVNRTRYSWEQRNKEIWEFVSYLQGYYQQLSEIPIVDHTDYEGKVDLELNCDLTDIDAINKELKKYDLAFVKKEVPLDMIVISDIKKAK